VAFVARFLGRRLAYTYELVELVPGDRLVMRTARGPFPMETTYTWQAAGDGSTRMTLRNRGEPSGLSRLADAVLVQGHPPSQPQGPRRPPPHPRVTRRMTLLHRHGGDHFLSVCMACCPRFGCQSASSGWRSWVASSSPRRSVVSSVASAWAVRIRRGIMVAATTSAAASTATLTVKPRVMASM
jgi:hypothetical protein